MKISPAWRGRVNFVVGVLLVWAGIGVARAVWDAFTLDISSKARLRSFQFCRVFDAFTENPPWGPSSCLVQTREYQINPTYAGDKYQSAIIEADSVVMVEMDTDDSHMKNLGPNQVAFEARLVLVQFITGPYSGRKGLIERSKLSPLPRRD